MKSEIKVVELFAGVGGFRLGLEGWDLTDSLSLEHILFMAYLKSVKPLYIQVIK